jgi:hypothetical protein
METFKLDDFKELGSMQHRDELQKTQNYKFSTLLPGNTQWIIIYSQK